MDCPECGTPLTTYRLADREASVCEQCGHVGIEAEHRAARARMETWTEALERFYGQGYAGGSTSPVRAADWDDPSPRQRAETWTEALERFYGDATPTAATGTGDDRADPSAHGTTPTVVAFDGTPVVRRTESE
ncbi:TFIIB-type zinc ribbon-containing protein [Salinigranum halophilum]|jgi:hypothetical protein|uniref:TFIIB-type zinc ribbon-containing protein n=1 Tax=Salinigranum halophilum TaxID=2565931 RepID=UPI0010A8CC26|nr:zf-TFIIB domain-containing protein [Salinigranum halophilum]